LTIIPEHLVGDREIHGEFPYSLKIHHLKSHVPAHAHNFLEYTYAIKGEAVEIINGVERKVEAGTFTLLFPHQVHEIRVVPGQDLYLYVGAIGLQAFFDRADAILSLQGLLKDAETDWHTSYALGGEYADRIHALLRQMHEEIGGGQTWRKVLFVAKLFEVFVWLNRHREAHSGVSRSHSPGTSAKNMRELVHYVYQHFREPVSLRSLAERSGFSVPHISAAFKKMTGENFSRFLERIRLAHACNLLLSGDMKVTDVCFEAGFASYPTFARVFQSRLGKSPLAYRRESSVVRQSGAEEGTALA